MLAEQLIDWRYGGLAYALGIIGATIAAAIVALRATGLSKKNEKETQ